MLSFSDDRQADIIDALILNPDIWIIFKTFIMLF